MALSPSDIADLRTDLLSFTRRMFKARRGVDMKQAPFHAAICAALERVVIGQSKRLIINIPPRSGKTEIAVKSFMAWCMGNWPDSEFIHASYSKELATANTWETRAIMQHEAFAEIFGPPALRTDSNAKDHFRTDQGGVVYSTGADGTITGFGAGKMRDTFGGAIIIDDPHKAGEANSKTMRDRVISWFQVTMESRKNTVDTPIIVIMQRLHEADLSGWLLAGGNGEAWDHVCIPAIDDGGESFWPDQFPVADLERKRAANSYVFAGQYMQRPAPVGGGIFKDQWWQYYNAPPVLEWRALYADTAQKTGTQNDYSVIQCWGKSRAGQAVMLDQIRGKWEAPELMVQARAFWAKHKQGASPLRAFKVEDKVSGTGLIQTLKREGIPMVAIQRDRDKVTRAYDTAPMIESGNVLLPEAAPWVSDFLAEASVFPNGQHDDQLDPMMDAIADMTTHQSQLSIRAL
jgi:predicted phage terminase large subunit-like protein